MPLETKNILITGASSGIGKSTAEFLAQKGFKVFAGVRKEDDFKELNAIHTNIIPIYLDVLNSESVLAAFETLTAQNVKLFALINNAGAVVAQPVECIDLDDLKYQFDINTIAPVRLAQTFLPLLEEGKIINISSMASTGIFPFIAPYCASKRALDILFNSMSLEFKNKNVKIISLKPGSIKTPIWNKSIKNNEKSMDKLPLEFKNKYQKELEFLALNAEKNNYKALAVEVVSRKIYQILIKKNPKSSYCVGFDSHFACAFSKLSQELINFFVKLKLRKI